MRGAAPREPPAQPTAHLLLTAASPGQLPVCLGRRGEQEQESGPQERERDEQIKTCSLPVAQGERAAHSHSTTWGNYTLHSPSRSGISVCDVCCYRCRGKVERVGEEV